MNAYSNMRARVTPIPTPLIVRMGSSTLLGLGVAVLSTHLSRGVQVSIMIAAIAAAFLLLFSHPYRREIKNYLHKHNAVLRPQVMQFAPLFLVWLALMIVPAFAPAPAYATALIWIGIAAWMFWVFPHVDGSRALAHLN